MTRELSEENTARAAASHGETLGAGSIPSSRTVAGNAASDGSSPRNTVFVFVNLPHGQIFDLPQGRHVALAGWPVSQLLGPHGEHLPGGRYGLTEVPVDHWNEVLRLYGEMAVLKSGLIFAAPSRKEGEAMARERGGLRHGLEPVDPETLITRPDTDNQPKRRSRQ